MKKYFWHGFQNHKSISNYLAREEISFFAERKLMHMLFYCTAFQGLNLGNDFTCVSKYYLTLTKL